MSYSDYYNLADDYIAHLDPIISSITDPFIKARYAGFISISAVTVYELAIKAIFIEFAQKKHAVFGNFTSGYFRRINGRIKKDEIINQYVAKFGEKYKIKFEKNLKKKEDEIFRKDKVSMIQSYSNIITWRHVFAHEGVVPTTATYKEVKKAYNVGKSFIDCLAESMTR